MLTHRLTYTRMPAAVFAGQTLLPWAYKLHIRSSLGEYQWSMDSSTRYLAVIKPDAVEIRSAEDEFGSRLRGWPIPNDPWPMWRQAAWSHDCEVLAIASSEGHVAIRSAHDGKLHHLVVKNSAASVFISPVAYMTLRKPRAGKFNGHTYAYEIVVVLVDGMLYCYLFNLVRENTTNDKAVTHVLGSTGNDGGFRLHHKRAVCGHLSCVVCTNLPPYTFFPMFQLDGCQAERPGKRARCRRIPTATGGPTDAPRRLAYRHSRRSDRVPQGRGGSSPFSHRGRRDSNAKTTHSGNFFFYVFIYFLFCVYSS